MTKKAFTLKGSCKKSFLTLPIGVKTSVVLSHGPICSCKPIELISAGSQNNVMKNMVALLMTIMLSSKQDFDFISANTKDFNYSFQGDG